MWWRRCAPEAPGLKQVLAVFSLDGKSYAVPIGADKGGDFKLRADDVFFIEDPHELYKHWPAEVWQKIDAHEVQNGMSELQVSFAIGYGVPQGSGGVWVADAAVSERREADGDCI